MKKLVIFTQNLEFGGIQKVVSKLSNYLTSYYEVSIILAENNKKIKQSLFSTISIYQIPTLKIDVNQKDIGHWLIEYRTKELDKILKEIKPDILFSFAEYNNIIALKTLYKCKKIISLRAVFESMKAKKIHFLTFNEYKVLMQRYYPLASHMVTVSNYIKNEIQEIVPQLRTTTIYNGIEKDETNYICDVFPPKEEYILNIGRLHSQKGQVDLIKAFNMIKNKIPHKLLIIGDGDERPILENLIVQLKLENRVFLMKGLIKPYIFMKSCDLFIFPSYYEGFPNTVIEAMRCKSAIISYKFEGYEEIFYRDDNLCDIGDIKELSSKILYYLVNLDERTVLKKESYLRSKNFTLENTLKKYKAVIEEVEKGLTNI